MLVLWGRNVGKISVPMKAHHSITRSCSPPNKNHMHRELREQDRAHATLFFCCFFRMSNNLWFNSGKRNKKIIIIFKKWCSAHVFCLQSNPRDTAPDLPLQLPPIILTGCCLPITASKGTRVRNFSFFFPRSSLCRALAGGGTHADRGSSPEGWFS